LPNKNYIRGVTFERELQKSFEKEFPGSTAYRTAGSHGEFDVIVLSKDSKEVFFIQAKTKLKDNPKGISQKVEEDWAGYHGETFKCFFLRFKKEVKKTKRGKK